jgi:hypothetical protein
MIVLIVTTNHHTFQARAVHVEKAQVLSRCTCTAGYDAAAKALVRRFYGESKVSTVREVKAANFPSLNAYIAKMTSPTPFKIFAFDK